MSENNIEQFDVEQKQNTSEDNDIMTKIKSFIGELTPIKIGIIVGSFIGVIVLIIIIAVCASGGNKNKEKEIDKYNIVYHENDGPLGNPMKGFVMRFSNSKVIVDPTSLEFFKINLTELWPSEDFLNLTLLEDKLERCAKRKRQLILRLVLDDPSYEGFSPKWFLKYGNFTYSRSKTMISPDYNNPNILSKLEYLYEKIGEKYNGDRRIAFWQLGTYGHWGEFHLTYAKEHEATNETYERIFNMHCNNLNKVHLVARRPMPQTEHRAVGFFHDVFGSEKYDEEMKQLFDQNGQFDRWQKYSFGGELYPDQQSKLFGNATLTEHYNEMTKLFHASWMFHADFYGDRESIIKKYSNFISERQKAERLMGYNYYVKYINISELEGSSNEMMDMKFTITVGNKGVAPFYFEWNIHFGVIEINGDNVTDTLQNEESDVFINGIQPNEEKVWIYKMKNIPKTYKEKENLFYAFRIPSGVDSYVKMANDEQREDETGWFIIRSTKI